MQKITPIAFVLLFLLSPFGLFPQRSVIDSLAQSLDQTQADTTRINTLNELCFQLSSVNRPVEAKKYGDEALRLSQKISWKKGEAIARHRIGTVLYEQGDYSESLSQHLQSLKLKEELKDQKGIAATCQNLGNVYMRLGNLAKSTDSYLRSLRIKEELGDKKGIANSLNSLGNIYKDQGKYTEALDYYEKALKIREELGNQRDIAQSYAAIGILYGVQKKFGKTIEYTEKSLQIYEKLDDPFGIAACMNSLALTYQHAGKYEKAEEYFLKSLKLNEAIGDKHGLTMLYGNLGDTYYLQKKYAKSLEYMKKAIALAEEIRSLEYMSITYFNISSVYEKRGDAALALKYYKQYASTKDSILNTESNKQITDAMALYNSEKKEKELSLLKKEREKQNALALAERQERLVIVVAFSAVLLLVIAFLIYVFVGYQRKKKSNLMLLQQKQLIEQKNRENENLLAEIHHRVKNNLQVVSSLLSLQGKSIEDSQARTAIEEGKQRVRSMELVHKMLYEGNSFSGIKLKDYAGKLINQLAQVFGITPDRFEVEIRAGDLKLDIDTAVPVAIILNELITNAFKYAYTKTQILRLIIEVEEEGNELKLQLADNGFGAQKDLILSSPSFGLKLVQLLTKQLNGSMAVSADSGLAYTFLFREYKLIR